VTAERESPSNPFGLA